MSIYKVPLWIWCVQFNVFNFGLSGWMVYAVAYSNSKPEPLRDRHVIINGYAISFIYAV